MSTQVLKNTGKTTAADGIGLAWRSWSPESPRGVIILVHGLAEHSGRYDELGSELASSGWAVYAADLRSHGLSFTGSGDIRVHVDRFEDFFLDVDAAFHLAGEGHPGLPRFILGHSMGGLIALRYAIEHPESLSGAVLSSPALGIHPDALPPKWLIPFVGLMSRLAPRFTQPTGLDEGTLSHDPEVVQAYIDDPLVAERVTVRWYAEFLAAIEAAHAGAPQLKLPVLLMQSGDDRIVDPAAAGRWCEKAPDGLVELVEWPGLYHEMFHELGKEKVTARTLAWLENAGAT